MACDTIEYTCTTAAHIPNSRVPSARGVHVIALFDSQICRAHYIRVCACAREFGDEYHQQHTHPHPHTHVHALTIQCVPPDAREHARLTSFTSLYVRSSLAVGTHAHACDPTRSIVCIRQICRTESAHSAAGSCRPVRDNEIIKQLNG